VRIARRGIAGPGQSCPDLARSRAGAPAQAFAPARDRGLVSAQVRGAQRGRVRADAQRERQAHQRDVGVERRRRRAAHADRVDAVHRGRQPGQGRRDLEDDACPASREFGHEAQELQHVAIALLGPDEDGPTRRLAAVPGRLRAWARTGLAACEAALVGTEAFVEAAFAQQCQRQVPAGVQVPRVGLHGGLERGAGAAAVAEALERHAQVVERRRRAGGAVHRLLEGEQGAAAVVAVAQQVAEVGPGVGVGGPQAQRLPVGLLGGHGVALALVRDAQQRPGVGARRRARQGRADQRQGVAVLAAQEQGMGAHERILVPGRCGNGRAGGCGGVHASRVRPARWYSAWKSVR